MDAAARSALLGHLACCQRADMRMLSVMSVQVSQHTSPACCRAARHPLHHCCGRLGPWGLHIATTRGVMTFQMRGLYSL